MNSREATCRNLRQEEGASLAEYALLVLLVAIVALAAVILVGEEVSGQFSDISSSLERANA